MGFLSLLFGEPAPLIAAKEVNERLKAGKRPLILDVRRDDEFNQGHINGAKLIPLNDLNRRMGELPKDREIVCVCASGNRSSSASKALVKAGYKAWNLQGGMVAWRSAKLPIVKKG